MSLLTLVPAPASVHASASDAPFVLSADVCVAGDADAAAAFVTLATARTGSSPQIAEQGAITFRLIPGGAAESYQATVAARTVTVTAPDAAGLFYAAQTLGQLVTRDGDRWILPAATIADAPRFAYRGLMIDVARHFFDVETVKACIDRAAGLKLNALHLHLSDDQGWRLHLDARPKLTELASQVAVGDDTGGFYTKADYAQIVQYAASRHMIVVPEFDMPGHTHAVGLAYPQIAAAPVIPDHDVEGGTPVAGMPYTGTAVGFSSLRTNDEATYDFVADVFGELAAMTPGPYLHFGGDESLATSPEEFATFVERTSQLIADLGKIPIAWHEAGTAAGLDDDTVGQYWGFLTPTDGMDDTARAFAAKGSRLILSPADAVYLDMKYDESTALGLTWAHGPTSIQRSYEWDPGMVIDGIGDAAILGVEAPLWTETVRTLDDIDEMAFPRIASAAEAGWSPAVGSSELRTWASFRERVGGLAPLWTGLGIDFFASSEIEWSDE